MKERSVRQGFSLLEVVVSVGILAVGILTIIALFTQLLRASQKSSDSSLGVLAAESVLNKTISDILNDTGVVSRTDFWNGNSPPDSPIEGSLKAGQTLMTYRITYQTLVDTAGDELGDDLPENRVKKVDIILWWGTDDPSETRVGYGQLSTSASRIINEQDEI